MNNMDNNNLPEERTTKRSILSRLPAAIDYIIGRLIILTLAFVWCRFYLPKLIDAIMFSIMITLAIISVFDIMLRRAPKSAAKREQLAAIDNLNEVLLYSDITQIKKRLVEILRTRHEDARLSGDYILIGGDNSPLKVIITYFSPAKLSPHDASQLIRSVMSLKPDKILLFTCGYTSAALSYTRRLISPEVKLLDHSDLHNLLLSYDLELNINPPKLRPEVEPKPAASALLNSAFEKKRVKGYIFASITMVIASFFIRFSLYYRIFASIFLILALLCLKRPYAKKSPKADII